MISLIRAEISKIQWGIVITLILMDMFINGAMGIMQLSDYKEFFAPSWSTLYEYAVNLHSMFFFPLYCGILASLLCHYEHRTGGWKLIMAMPVSRSQIYYAKFLLLLLLLGATQALFVVGYLASGLIADPPGSIPWSTVLLSMIGGWLGIFPLSALQLMISARVRSFGAALALNMCCVIPNIVMTGFYSFVGAWFPFTIPYYVMMPQTASYAPRVEPYSLAIIILFTAIFYIILGQRKFLNKDW